MAAMVAEMDDTISIHAPREGSDDRVLGRYKSPSISIHAPREGSDRCLPEQCLAYEFQSTLPVRGATAAAKTQYINL